MRKEARGDFSWKDKRNIWKAIFSFEVSLWKITFKILIRAISHESIFVYTRIQVKSSIIRSKKIFFDEILLVYEYFINVKIFGNANELSELIFLYTKIFIIDYMSLYIN